MAGMFQNNTIFEIIQRYRVVWAVGHASSVLNWDFETYMPSEGTLARAIADSELSLLQQRFTLSLKELVSQAEKESQSLNDEEKGIVRVGGCKQRDTQVLGDARGNKIQNGCVNASFRN